jgi:hypothetical protein
MCHEGVGGIAIREPHPCGAPQLPPGCVADVLSSSASATREKALFGALAASKDELDRCKSVSLFRIPGKNNPKRVLPESLVFWIQGHCRDIGQD